MRINARLDPDFERKLAYIQQQTHQGITDIVKSAIDLYYQKLQATQQHPLSMLTQTGFIGCGRADSDLSVNYKSILKERLKAKHGYR